MDEVSNDSMQTMNASVFEPRTSQPLQPTRPPGEAEDAVAATLTAGTADLEEGADIDKSISPSPPIDVTGETDETLNGSPQVVVSDEAESDQTSVRHLTEHEAEPEIESVEETAHAPEKGQVDKAAVQSGNQSVQKDATAPDTLMDKTSPVSDGETSRHAIRSAVDSKAISPQEDVNGVSTSKPAAPEDVSVKATAPEPPGNNHPSNSSSVKVYYQTGSSQDTSAATGATSAQGSQGELLADDGTESTALLKNFGFSPQTASPGKGPSMETTSQEALSLDSASDTISSKILSASASGDAGNQFTRDGQFQDNLFTLMRDGIIQTPAATTPSPGQATGSLSLGYATWPADLAQWIAQLHGRKSNYLTLELEPKHLGRVVVSVETDDNKVSATISTESENVRSLLSQGSTSLRQQLESMGLELSQLTINVGQNQNDQTSYRRSGTGGTRTKRSTQSGRQSGVVQDATAMALEQGSTNHLINVFV